MRTIEDPKVSVLRRVPALRGYGRRELARLAVLFDQVEFAEGDLLIREGRPGAETFLLVDGQASVSVGGRHVGRAGPGEFVGEMALLDRGARSATVTAETSVKALALDPAAFASLLNEPAVTRRIAAVIARRLRELERAPSYEAAR